MKGLTTSIGYIVSYLLLAILIYSVANGMNSIIGVAVCIYWIFIFLGVGVGFVILIFSCAIKDGFAAEHTQKSLELFRKLTKKRNILMRAIGWLELFATVIFLAYSGWIFTGVCYVFSSLILRVLISMALENVDALLKAEVA